MAKFDPEFYSRYRPLYPEGVFESMPSLLKQAGRSSPFQMADVACGTGHSTKSLAQALSRLGIKACITAVEPDSGMLEKARQDRDLIEVGVQFVEGAGELLPLAKETQDVITVGSAFHWMRAIEAREEFLRVLRPRGLIFIFEYQFPKCRELPLLNEWVRREFNLRWKAPSQFPRGDFEAVTACFRDDSRIELIADYRPPMILGLSAEDLTGLILSQSRVLHYQNALSDRETMEFHHDIRTKMKEFLGLKTALFDFNLSAAKFRKNH